MYSVSLYERRSAERGKARSDGRPTPEPKAIGGREIVNHERKTNKIWMLAEEKVCISLAMSRGGGPEGENRRLFALRRKGLVTI